MCADVRPRRVAECECGDRVVGYIRDYIYPYTYYTLRQTVEHAGEQDGQGCTAERKYVGESAADGADGSLCGQACGGRARIHGR